MNVNKTFLTTKKLGSAVLIAISMSCLSIVHAGVNDQAKRIHERLTGVPPSAAVLATMVTQLNAGDGVAAAQIAMQNSFFYNSTLKNFVTPWTDSQRSILGDLNDYTATVIGVVRDDYDFRRILYDDILYTAAANVPTAYSKTDNDHYVEIQSTLLDMKNPAMLVETTQSAVTGLAAADTAGVLTTRQSGKAFLDMGTNRRLFEYTILNHLCISLEDANDITRTPDRIRQDVSRNPGGDSSVYLNTCIGCHTGMDPMIQAFAYYNYNSDAEDTIVLLKDQMVFEANTVQAKYLQNSGVFPVGYITPNNNWENYWRAGKNAALGWGWKTEPNAQAGKGTGAKSMGREFAYSKAFASCQVTKVFKTVCLRPPSSPADRTEVSRITDVFDASTYKLKTVFAETANYCKGN
ncbi:MAG: hypothetical protein ACC653_00070 [Gammaproteobacteria bacterium]